MQASKDLILKRKSMMLTMMNMISMEAVDSVKFPFEIIKESNHTYAVINSIKISTNSYNLLFVHWQNLW